MIRIFDNLFTSQETENIESIVTDCHFPWHLSAAKCASVPLDYAKLNADRETLESAMMVHTLVSVEHGAVSIHKIWADLISSRIMESAGIAGSVVRAKFNFHSKAQASGKYHTPHIDSEAAHLVAIYYVNDSDGDTRIFNRKFGEPTPEVHSLARAVTPKAGRVVLFSGEHFHASANPVQHDYRIVLNMNIVESKQ
jgi:hypothetical protein